ncbi:MAG: hypothetical protein ABFD98_18585 [Syntrophobacteraceae bacterium]|nr:hypothetical protein [Desulfobacteraceae bacterium]
MVSSVTSPSVIASLQSRQATDPTVNVSQASPSVNSAQNTVTSDLSAAFPERRGAAPDRVTLSPEGLAASNGNGSTEQVASAAKEPATLTETPEQAAATDPGRNLSNIPVQERTAEFARLQQQQSVQMQQDAQSTPGVLNVGSILNMVA